VEEEKQKIYGTVCAVAAGVYVRFSQPMLASTLFWFSQNDALKISQL
jgi:hypothetical protein